MLSRFLTKKEQLILTLFAAAIVVGAITVYGLQTRSQPPREQIPDPVVAHPAARTTGAQPSSPVPTDAAPSDPAPPGSRSQFAVFIRGAIRNPGLYRLDPGARIQDLIDRAGGAKAGADLTHINLAARLIDGTTLIIPSDEERPRGSRRSPLGGSDPVFVMNRPEYLIGSWKRATPAVEAQPVPSESTGGPLDLNRATQADLERLPGIGPKLASTILAHRAAQPFRKAEDLLEVRGIGPKRFAAVRDLIAVH